MTLCADEGLGFAESLENLITKYDATLKSNSLDRESAVFLRFHVSDASTQTDELKKCLQDFGSCILVSVVQQPPFPSSKVALEAYHVASSQGHLKKSVEDGQLLLEHGNYSSLWGSLVARDGEATSHDQTTGILNTLSDIVGRHGSTVLDNVVRTWLYVRDIDNNYAGMVDARREWFNTEGLTPETHYIASTGIEGSVARPANLVLLDFLSVQGLTPRQVDYLHGKDNFCRTDEYGVTFERATRITYGDRTHYYISGTASIDNSGDVVHVGDVLAQTCRTLDNVSVLLDEGGATMEDLKILIVYLRDGSDSKRVDKYLKEQLPAGVAYQVVTGSVCRPQWLIEVDGFAVNNRCDPSFEPYC